MPEPVESEIVSVAYKCEYCGTVQDVPYAEILEWGLGAMRLIQCPYCGNPNLRKGIRTV